MKNLKTFVAISPELRGYYDEIEKQAKYNYCFFFFIVKIVYIKNIYKYVFYWTISDYANCIYTGFECGFDLVLH